MRLCDRWQVFSVSGRYFFCFRSGNICRLLTFFILQIGALIWICTRSSETKKLYIYIIVNIGWHHESIVPDILEMNWNVRDFFIKLERKVLEKKGEEK